MLVVRNSYKSSRTEVFVPEEPTPCPTPEQPKRQQSRPAASDALRHTALPRQAQWQGILFRDGRAWGKLVDPSAHFLSIAPADAAGQGQEGAEAQQPRVGQLTLQFTRVIPAGSSNTSGGASDGGGAGQAQPLCLFVDEEFARHSYRVQVIGRQGGASFVVPHRYQASGRELTSGLGVQQQWQEFQQRHQAARTSAGQPTSTTNLAHSSTLTVQSGDGLERLQAIFDVATLPAWLKGIVCRFLVAEAEQPSQAQAVDGSSSCCVDTGEQGTATATSAAAPAGPANDSMAAPAAAGHTAEQQAGSWLAAAQREALQQGQRAQQAQQAEPQSAATPATAPMEQAPAVAQVQAQPAVTQATAQPAPPSQPAQGHKEGKKRGRHAHAAKQQRDPSVATCSSSDVPAGAGNQQTRARSRGSGSRDRSLQSRSSRGSRSSTPAPEGSSTSPLQSPQRTGNSPGPEGQPQHLSLALAQNDPNEQEHLLLAAAAAAADSTGMVGRRRSRSGSRSGSGSRHKGGQDAEIVRRLPSLFPAATAQPQPQPQPQAAAASTASLLSVPEGVEATAACPSDGASSSVASMPSEKGLQGSSPTSSPAITVQWPQGAAPVAPAACTSQPGRCKPARAASPAKPATAAVASAPAQAAPSCDPAKEAAVAAARAMEGSQKPQAAAEAACSKQPIMAEDSAQAAAQPPVWQCTVESYSAVAAAPPAGPPQASAFAVPQQQQRPGSSCSTSDAASRPLSPHSGGASSAESVCSEGSAQSQPEAQCAPTNPSEFGLPYNFGCNPMLFQWQNTPGVSFAAHQQQLPGHVSPPKPATEMRPSHRRRSSFGTSHSMSLSSGTGYAVPLAANGLAGPQFAFHRRTNSNSSSSNGSSQGSGSDAGFGAAAAAAGGQGIMPMQWQAHAAAGAGGWGDVFPSSSCSQLPAQHPPASYLPRSKSTGTGSRAQWARHHHSSVPAGDISSDFFWQPRRRNASWAPDAVAQYGQPPEQGGLPLGAGMQYAPAAMAGVSAASSRFGRAAQASASANAGYSAASMPAAGIGSQPAFVGSGRQGSSPSPAAPPPPPVKVPVIDLQVPESADDSPDLERFLQAATPQVLPPPTGLHDLTLADLWRWYEAPSTVGCEVTTIGGPRGPVTSYYLPFLSSIQMLVPARDGEQQAGAPAAVGLPAAVTGPAAAKGAAGAAAVAGPGSDLVLSYPNGLDSWPERMRPLVQWGEDANMRDRIPLHSRLQELCGEAGAAHPLMATHVGDLHPFSWFAVAWYPLYCVPEAPLTARFLTFHTLASLWESATEAAEKHRLQHQEEEQLAAAAAMAAAEAAAETAAGAQQVQGPAQAGDGFGQEGQEGEQAEDVAAAAALERQFLLAAGAPAPVVPAAIHGALPSRPSYKSMLEAGLPQAAAPRATMPRGIDTTATPTAVCSFPSSPTCSDTATRTTLGGSRPTSVDGSSGRGAHGDSASHRDNASASASTTISLHGSGSDRSCPPSASPSLAGSSVPASEDGDNEEASQLATAAPAASGAATAAAAADPLPVPVAGLVWYATGQDENWLDTLVAAQLPPGLSPSPGATLPGCGRVVGSWRGVAVLARSYPVGKGGPLGWEIQQEEMAQCAERLAGGMGLVALRPRPARGSSGSCGCEEVPGLSAAAMGINCPDYEFFCSRLQRFC